MGMEPSPRPPSINPRAMWIVLSNTLLLGVLLLCFWKLRTIVSWVLIAGFLALAFEPLVAWLTRHRFKRGWAVLTLALVLLGAGVAISATFAPKVVDQAAELSSRGPELIQKIEDSAPVSWADRRFQVLDKVQAAIDERRSGGGVGEVAGPAMAIVGGVLHGLAATVTVISLTIFMLLFGGKVVEKGLAWLKPGQRERWRTLAGRMRKVVGGYVAGTFVVAGIGGVAMGVTLAVLGVPYFLPLALVMVVLGIIPFLGSALGAVILTAVTFAAAGPRQALIFAVVYLVYQQVENEVLQPVVQRRTLKMNPLLITFALLAGTGLAGVVGTLLALPAAGALQVMLQDTLQRRQARSNRILQDEGPGSPALTASLSPQSERRIDSH